MISRHKQRAAAGAVQKLSTIEGELTTHTASFASDEMWAKVPSLVEKAQALLKEIQVLTCPHPAFAAGRCFKCNATHEEAK